jgi:GNAT superfamily N-acetyltransferase
VVNRHSPVSDLKIGIFHATDKPMRITLRHAVAEDFEDCQRLYFAGMKNLIEELGLDMAAQTATFSEQWALEQVRIISADGSDVGWLQTDVREEGVFVGQLFVDGPSQGQGIGTEVMKQVIREAAGLNQAVSLAVVKINPALRLYKRLGFRITHHDDRKFYMRRDPDAAGFP